MHAFIDDHLIVLDPFGLTRVTLPNKVKSNKKVSGEFLKANGKLLVGRSNISNRGFAMTVPELKVISVDKDWGYNLHYQTSTAVTPAGLPIDAETDALVLYDLKGKEKGRLPRPKTKPRGKVDLGPTFPSDASDARLLAVGVDGTFVVFADEALWGGKLTEGKKATITDAWSATIARPQGQRSVKAGAFGAFASTFQRSQGKAYCVLVADGKLAHAVVDCVGPVDFDGANIVYQSSTSEVCRVSIAGGAADRFDLPKSAHGIGQVMADGEHVMFLTPDHEGILDLATDDTVDRGLPAGERAMRTKLLAFIHGFDAVAARANLHVRLTSLSPPAYGRGPRPHWDWDAGDHSVMRLLVIGNVVAASYRDRELSAGSFSNPQELAPVTEGDMVRTLEAIDAHELDLLAGLCTLDSPLSNYYDATFGTPKKREPRFESGAAQALLWAIVESLGKKQQPKLAAKAAKWATQPITAAQLIAKLDPSRDWRRGDMSDAQTSAAWVVVDYLQADAFDVMYDWLIERQSPMVDANMHIVSDPVKALAKMYPKQGKAFAAKLAAVAKRKNAKLAERAASLISNLD